MTVLFFAHTRKITGVESLEWEVTIPQDSTMLWEWLIKRYPSLEALKTSTRLARNEVYLSESEMLYPKDVVALIPPVSGG